MEGFDYETKLWGGTEVRTSPIYLGASRLKWALEDIRDIKGRVLEVGCGGGGMARAIKFYRPDLDVYGIDISEKAIQEARRNPGGNAERPIAPLSGAGVKFQLGDAYHLPFDNATLDAVVMFDVLEHLDDPQRSLQEIQRVLKPGGIFSAFVPIEGNPFSLHGIAKRLFGFIPKEKYGGHVQQFTLSDLQKLLQSTNLRFIRKRYFGHFFNQLVDFTYFTLLYLRGRNVPYSVEGFVAKERGLKRDLIAFLKSSIAVIGYLESEILWFLPASGVHITATKIS